MSLDGSGRNRNRRTIFARIAKPKVAGLLKQDDGQGLWLIYIQRPFPLLEEKTRHSLAKFVFVPARRVEGYSFNHDASDL